VHTVSNEIHNQVEDQIIEDGLVIDTSTGEVIGFADGGATLRLTELKVEELPRILRAVRSLERRQEMIQKYARQESDRIMVACQSKMNKLGQQVSYLSSTAERMLSQIGERKMEYPGLGVVRWRKVPASVDTSKFDELDLPDKFSLGAPGNVLSDYLRTKTTITPDKAAIKKALKTDELRGAVESLFSLTEPGDKFEFKFEQ